MENWCVCVAICEVPRPNLVLFINYPCCLCMVSNHVSNCHYPKCYMKLVWQVNDTQIWYYHKLDYDTKNDLEDERCQRWWGSVLSVAIGAVRIMIELLLWWCDDELRRCWNCSPKLFRRWHHSTSHYEPDWSPIYCAIKVTKIPICALKHFLEDDDLLWLRTSQWQRGAWSNSWWRSQFEDQ